jgi:hypothetical protein
LDSLQNVENTEELKKPLVVAFEKDDPTNWHI